MHSIVSNWHDMIIVYFEFLQLQQLQTNNSNTAAGTTSHSFVSYVDTVITLAYKAFQYSHISFQTDAKSEVST